MKIDGDAERIQVQPELVIDSGFGCIEPVTGAIQHAAYRDAFAEALAILDAEAEKPDLSPDGVLLRACRGMNEYERCDDTGF